MKISESTFNLLENYSKINQSIEFSKGSTLRTISPQKTIIAFANIDEEFNDSYCIYDLDQILRLRRLFKEPNFEFNDENLVISDESNKKVNYLYTSPEMIVRLKDESFLKLTEQSIPNMQYIVELNLKSEDIKSVINACQIMKLKNFTVIGKNGKVSLRATDKDIERTEQQTSNDFCIELDECNNDFEVVFKCEHIYKLMDGLNYILKLNDNYGIFINNDWNDNKGITYVVTAEA